MNTGQSEEEVMGGERSLEEKQLALNTSTLRLCLILSSEVLTIDWILLQDKERMM